MSDDAYTEVRRGFARRHGLPESAAGRIKGEALEEMEADAKALADAVGAQPPAPENPNAALAALFMVGDKDQRNAAFVERLHGSPDPAAEELSQSTGFDGGVREPAPLDRDPYKDHDELILGLLQETGPVGPDVVFWGRPPATQPAKDQEPDEGDWRKGGT